jgi:hypothetical protein
MPYGLRKLPNEDLYKVFNKETGEVHSKATTKGNALKQIRLLYMIEREKEKEKSGSGLDSMGYYTNSYPKEERSMEQDRVSGGMVCKVCGAGKGRPKGSKMSDEKRIEREKQKSLQRHLQRKVPPEVQEIVGFHKPLAKKTFQEPYKPQGSYMTPWRWVLYKEKELQNTTYPNVMKQPKVKELYYKLKDIADEEFSIEWLEQNYMKRRKGISEPVKQPKAKKVVPSQSTKITKFFNKSEDLEE